MKKVADAVGNTVAAMAKNPKLLLLLLILFLLVAVIGGVVSSCSVMFQGAMSSTVSTSYTSENEELITTDNNYTALETALQTQINRIERDYPDYDEYCYNLATIGHDPHQLASYLTALLQYFKANEVQGELQRVFERQYELTLTQTVEVPYRTETRTDTWTDEEGNTHTDTYTEEVPYDYYILNVKLTNQSINGVANSLLTPEQLEMYNVYLQTKGNKPLLFGGGSIDGSRVYTVEGNSGDACKVRDYDLNSSVIMGYGLMN